MTTVLTTARLELREMDEGDLDDFARLLGDPGVMRYYPRPRTRAETLEWIGRNRRRYRADGFGLWTVRLRDGGAFVGDCGLTVQRVAGKAGLTLRRRTRGYGDGTQEVLIFAAEL